MLTTTSDFDDAAVATIRRPKGRVTITWAGAFIDTGLVLTPDDENNVSDVNHVVNMKDESNYKWFMLDGTAILDDSFKLFPEPTQNVYEVGWYSDSIGDGSGDFSPAIKLQIEFSSRPVYGIFVAGENTIDQYPVDFTVEIYNGVSLEDTVTVTGNTEVKYSESVSVSAATKMILSITKWSEPNTCVKILEFYSSLERVYEGDVVSKISVLEEREIRDGTTPIGNISCNEVSISLQNIEVDGVIDPFFPGNTNSDLNALLKPGRRVHVELGFQLPDNTNEYVSMGTYWIEDFIINDSDSSISFTARDRMSLLKKLIYDDNEPETSIYFNNLLVDIILSLINKMPDFEYTMSSGWVISLANSFVDKVSYFEAFKQVAAAIGGNVYMSRIDDLVLEAPSVIADTGIPDLFITKSQYFTKNQPSNNEEIINKVEIETQPRVAAASLETVYESDEAISIGASETLDPIEIKYTSFPVSAGAASIIDITGSADPQIDNVSYYSWGALLEISNHNANAGTFKILVEGKPLNLIGSTIVTSTDGASILQNGEKVYRLPTNNLLQQQSIAQDIADELITSYSEPRNDLTLEWRGNPALELGDVIVVPIYQKGSIDTNGVFKIYKLQTNFDGTLKQTISARYIEIYIP